MNYWFRIFRDCRRIRYPATVPFKRVNEKFKKTKKAEAPAASCLARAAIA